MSYNGSGAFNINTAGQPVVADTTISATVFNDLTADLATGLSTCLLKDGTQTVTANIPLATFKLTGVGNGTDKQDAATIANIVAGTGVYVGTVGGTADEITLTPSPAITAYAAGQQFYFIAGGTNTTNVTVAISGLTAKAITKNGTTALVAGDIRSGQIVLMTYDGTRFIMGVNRICNVAAVSASSTSVDFTSIPSGVRRVIVNFVNLSTDGTDPLLIQIGDSGGVETTNYVSASTLTVAGGATTGGNSTAGYIIQSVLAANALTGSYVLNNGDADSTGQTWYGSGNLVRLTGNSEIIHAAGYKVLSAHLDRVRITTSGGTNAFDNGTIGISYEF